MWRQQSVAPLFSRRAPKIDNPRERNDFVRRINVQPAIHRRSFGRLSGYSQNLFGAGHRVQWGKLYHFAEGLSISEALEQIVKQMQLQQKSSALRSWVSFWLLWFTATKPVLALWSILTTTSALNVP
jgi:hypothetical protein